jgi:threonine/homoserine/homoserine lactone efflux protein
VYWYALTNGLASIFLIVYGLAMGIVPLLAGNILMIFALVLLGSLATTVLGLAIAFTFVWLLRKLLQTPDEPKQNNELPPQS